jgi:hydrogenase-4 component F
VDGRPRAAARKSTERFPELPGVIIPPLLFLAFSLWLGLATPSLLREAWTSAARFLFPTP